MRTFIAVLIMVGTLHGQQVMPENWRQGYKSALPQTDDPIAREIFDSPRTIWYDHRHLHPMTQGSRFPNQRFGGQLEGIRGVNSVYSNPGPNNRSQANREYPWDLTLGGGSHGAPNLKTVKAFLLPEDEDGRTLPVVVFGSSPLRWCFPNGTIFAEVAYLVRDGAWYACEVRLRVKEPDDWRTSRLLPYANRDDLVAKVGQTHPTVAKLIPQGKVERVRIQSRHPRPAINSVGTMQTLPTFPVALTKRLLTQTNFEATEGEIEYASGIDGPTTDEEFHIRPKGDLTANHGQGSRESCRQCHQTIGKHARVFDMNREWYLSVRGSSGIFSWHPWPNTMARQNGNPNSLRPAWVQHGIVARFNPRVHTADTYSRDAFLADEIRRGVN